ncbi:AAA family ATPase [Vibrio breoganii]
MLSKINIVGEWYQNEPDTSWNFPELKFDNEAKSSFESLDLDITVSDSSARISITGSDNHAYISSQYFLYIIKLAPLSYLVNQYLDKFNQLAHAINKPDDVAQFIGDRADSQSVISGIDPYSLTNFYDVFDVTTAENRLNAKDIINGYGKTATTKIRPNEDFLKSILLKALPIPNSSSGMLGVLASAFAKNKAAYNVLFDKYSVYLPHLFRAQGGDELLFMILSTLGWQGKLDSELGATPSRFSNWGSIDKAFLFSPTPVSGNTQYVEEPIHHSPSLNQYVYIKKGLLDTDELITTVSELISGFWHNMSIQKDDGEFFFKSSFCFDSKAPAFIGATNKIFYGAPGTGKSHHIHNVECGDADTITTVFHPDTQYSDFVGALKPNMSTDENGKPYIAYQFRAGPFTKALIEAKLHPYKHICLVIEELNRAPAAAVFGELFQLLDREDNGESTYKIDASDPDMLAYINQSLDKAGVTNIKQLEIPSNLSLLATMNSSDQAVMPLDTAFKRRWRFKFFDIDFSHTDVPNHDFHLSTQGGVFKISWPKLASIINDVLIEAHVAEDRLLGPFFVKKEEIETAEAAKETLSSKLFVYLWDDVLRHIGPKKIFASEYLTYGRLSSAYMKGKAIFNNKVEERIEENGTLLEEPAIDAAE